MPIQNLASFENVTKMPFHKMCNKKYYVDIKRYNIQIQRKGGPKLLSIPLNATRGHWGGTWRVKKLAKDTSQALRIWILRDDDDNADDSLTTNGNTKFEMENKSWFQLHDYIVLLAKVFVFSGDEWENRAEPSRAEQILVKGQYLSSAYA